MRTISNFKRLIILMICFVLAFPTQIFANFTKPNSTLAFKKIVGENNLFEFNLASEKGRILESRYRNMGYSQWKEVLYGTEKEGQFRVYLPRLFDEKNLSNPSNYTILKNMLENRTNKYGAGGLHLVNKNDYNVKYGWDVPYGNSENMYDENGGNIKLPNGRTGELRFIGYNIYGEEVNNPYFPDDRVSTVDAWNKNWIPFGPYGGMSEHRMSRINNDEIEAKKILTDFFLRHETGKKMIKSDKYVGKKGMDGRTYTSAFTKDWEGKDILTDEAFEYWNNRLRIEQNSSDLNIMLTGNWKRDDGHVLYQTFTCPKIVRESTFIRNFKLTEEGKEEPLIQSIIRESSMLRMNGGAPISEIELFNYYVPNSRSLMRTEDKYFNPKLPTLKLGGKYDAVGEIVHAKINPDKEGEDIKKGEPTKTQPPKIHFQYQYLDAISGNWDVVGGSVWAWEGKETLTPLVSDRTKSSPVVATIKWPEDISSPTKRYVKGRVLIKIPEIFKTNEDDYWEPDNLAVLEFNVAAGNDMGMKEPVILKNPQGKPVEGPEVGNDHTLDFIVENLTEQEISDPNTTIDVVVTDKTTNDVIYKDTVVADKITGPNEEVTITTPNITINSNKVEACAVINKIHKEQGENLIESNDTVCAEFGLNQDMEMGSKVTLKDKSGKEVGSFGPNENHSLEFVVKHVKGNVPVGTENHSTVNPNATIDVEIKDANNKVIHNKTYVANKVLQPNGTISITTDSIKTNSSTITACAVINKKHDEKGFNIRSNKDRVCETFGSQKNLSVKQLKVTPNIVESETGSAVKKLITFDYEVAYDTTGSEQIETELTFKGNGQTMFTEKIYISPGETLEGSKLAELTIPSGGVKFELIINNTRKHKEYLSNGSDAYKDNSKTASVTFRKLPECVDCDKSSKVGKSNSWKEQITWNKIVGDKKTYYGPFKITDQDGKVRSCDGKCTCSSSCYSHCSGHTVSRGCYSSCPDNCAGGHTTTEYRGDDCCDHHSNHYCSGHSFCVSGDWKQRTVTSKVEQDYTEKYGIQKVYYKSKWSQDKFGGDGWIEVKQGDTVKIKSGYAFDIKVVTHYETTRKPNNVPQPPAAFTSDKGECKVEIKAPFYTAKERDPGVPTQVYARFKSNGAVSDDCYILKGTNGSNWWNQSITHKLEERDNKSGTGKVTGIYVSENAKPNQIIKVNLTTPIWNGYSPSNVLSVQGGQFKKLQDCFNFNIEIIANNDVNSSIIQ